MVRDTAVTQAVHGHFFRRSVTDAAVMAEAATLLGGIGVHGTNYVRPPLIWRMKTCSNLRRQLWRSEDEEPVMMCPFLR